MSGTVGIPLSNIGGTVAQEPRLCRGYVPTMSQLIIILFKNIYMYAYFLICE
jgi:hypothetical protein